MDKIETSFAQHLEQLSLHRFVPDQLEVVAIIALLKRNDMRWPSIHPYLVDIKRMVRIPELDVKLDAGFILLLGHGAVSSDSSWGKDRHRLGQDHLLEANDCYRAVLLFLDCEALTLNVIKAQDTRDKRIEIGRVVDWQDLLVLNLIKETCDLGRIDPVWQLIEIIVGQYPARALA